MVHHKDLEKREQIKPHISRTQETDSKAEINETKTEQKR